MMGKVQIVVSGQVAISNGFTLENVASWKCISCSLAGKSIDIWGVDVRPIPQAPKIIPTGLQSSWVQMLETQVSFWT